MFDRCQILKKVEVFKPVLCCSFRAIDDDSRVVTTSFVDIVLITLRYRQLSMAGSFSTRNDIVHRHSCRQRYTLDNIILSRVYQGSIEGISRIYRESIEGLSRVYRGFIEGLSRVYRGSIEGYRGSIEGLSRVYRGSIESLF